MPSNHAPTTPRDFLPRKSDEEDASLVLRIGSEDQTSFALLYRHYHQRIVGFVERFTPRVNVIEEAINYTFMILWRKAAKFCGR